MLPSLMVGSLGFKTEGVARGNAYFRGVDRDTLIISILRPEGIAAG